MAMTGEQYRRVVEALAKLIEQGIVAMPRWHKLCGGARGALEMQRDSVVEGTFLNIYHNWVRFQLEGEELVFPKQRNLRDDLRIKLAWLETPSPSIGIE